MNGFMFEVFHTHIKSYKNNAWTEKTCTDAHTLKECEMEQTKPKKNILDDEYFSI